VAFQWVTVFGLHQLFSKMKEKKGKVNNLPFSLNFQLCVSLEQSETVILIILVPSILSSKQGAKRNNLMETASKEQKETTL